MGSPTLLAWCSQYTNKIDIVDLSTKENYASFNGVKTSDTGLGFQLFWGWYAVIFLGIHWTHVKEIPNTNLLVSLNHIKHYSANMSVYDISKADQIKEVYSLGEVSGKCIIIFFTFVCWIIFSLATGDGDITYNSRRGILGAIPLEKEISYHLFNVDSKVSKTKNIVKLTRKSKWHSQYGNHQS